MYIHTFLVVSERHNSPGQFEQTADAIRAAINRRCKIDSVWNATDLWNRPENYSLDYYVMCWRCSSTLRSDARCHRNYMRCPNQSARETRACVWSVCSSAKNSILNVSFGIVGYQIRTLNGAQLRATRTVYNLSVWYARRSIEIRIDYNWMWKRSSHLLWAN